MRPDPAYRNAYPGAGELVLLCEGDVLGYEAILLGKWLAVEKLERLVDVTPCGTKSAIYGFADALGRSRPLVAVEDRDYRTQCEANADCQEHKGDRERRGCQVVDWRCWQRNEIENYLLAAEVLEPVMAEHFACSCDEVRAALDEVLRALIVCQCAERALSRAERIHEEVGTDLRRRLRDISRRPSWCSEGSGLAAPDAVEVGEELAKQAESWRSEGKCQPLTDSIKCVVDDFMEVARALGGDDDVPSDWETEWTGKEIMKYLRMLLAARHGWMDKSGGRQLVRWDLLRNRGERDALDRQIERAINKPITDACVEWLGRTDANEASDEWKQLADVIRAAL